MASMHSLLVDLGMADPLPRARHTDRRRRPPAPPIRWRVTYSRALGGWMARPNAIGIYAEPGIPFVTFRTLADAHDYATRRAHEGPR